jgi:aminoglycoside phosphotransferase (APT) family kinase protein
MVVVLLKFDAGYTRFRTTGNRVKGTPRQSRSMTDPEELVEEEGLRGFLVEHVGDATGLEVDRHDEGFSNETIFVNWGDHELVLRRPPLGETAETAHDVLREYTAMDALQDTAVPVPRTVAACEDRGVIGSEFYVMERLEGDVVRFSEPDRFGDPRVRREVAEGVVETLAAIHGVDVDGVGLSDFGDPDGFTRRQVERWTEQIEWAFEETTEEREVPALREVGDWLAENAPDENPGALVHGDYKLDNLVFDPDGPRVAGVLDWEMSALGDPLCDLGWLLFFWRDENDEESKITQTMLPQFTKRDGYPSRDKLVEMYEDRAGVTVENPRFYRVLAAYKMCALGEMFYARYLMGNSDSTFYAMMEDGVPLLAEDALRMTEER